MRYQTITAFLSQQCQTTEDTLQIALKTGHYVLLIKLVTTNITVE